VLANLALSVLDEHIAQMPGGPDSSQSQRATPRRKGLGNYRLVRHADDWLLMVSGSREHAEQMRGRAAALLAPMGLRLSAEKTKITQSTMALTFSAGASSATVSGAPTGNTSTPTRPAKRSRR
jgi:RNA-directed DNA polymerase